MEPRPTRRAGLVRHTYRSHRSAVAARLFYGVVIAANVALMTLAISTMPGTEVESLYRWHQVQW
jgi:nitrogen fixation protein FixH